jgi:hypothetical protein
MSLQDTPFLNKNKYFNFLSLINYNNIMHVYSDGRHYTYSKI